MRTSHWLLAFLALVWAGAAMAQTPDIRCGAVTIFGPPTQTIDMGVYYKGHPYLVRTGAGCNAYRAFTASGNIACSGDDYLWLDGDVRISGSNGGCKVDNRDSAHRSQGTIWDGQVDVLPAPPAEKCNLPYFKAHADLIFKNNGTVVDSTGADVTSQYARTSSGPGDPTRLFFKGTEWVTISYGLQGQWALDHKTLYFENCGVWLKEGLGITGDGTPAQYVPLNVTMAVDGHIRADGRPQALSYNDPVTKAVIVSGGDLLIGTLDSGMYSNCLSRIRGSVCANDNLILKGPLGPGKKPEFYRQTTATPPYWAGSQPPSKMTTTLFEGTVTVFNDGSDPSLTTNTRITYDQAFVFDCNTYKPMGCYPF